MTEKNPVLRSIRAAIRFCLLFQAFLFGLVPFVTAKTTVDFDPRIDFFEI